MIARLSLPARSPMDRETVRPPAPRRGRRPVTCGLSGGRYWDRTSGLFGVKKVKIHPTLGHLFERAAKSLGQCRPLVVFVVALCKIVSQNSPKRPGTSWPVRASRRASFARPGRACLVQVERPTGRTTWTRQARSGCLRGAMGYRGGAIPERPGSGGGAPAAGGPVRVVGPEALPAGGALTRSKPRPGGNRQAALLCAGYRPAERRHRMGGTGTIVIGATVLVEIQGADLRTELDLHRAFESQLDFGPYYGRNLDALWDRLSTDIERPVHLVWHDADVSRRQLGTGLYDRIRQVLDGVVEQDERFGWNDRFTYELR